MAGADENRTQARWWADDVPFDVPGAEARNSKVRGQRLAGVVAALWRAQEPLRQEYKTAWRLYSQRAIAGLGPRMYRGHSGRRGKPMGLNLCKAVSDAYVSLITKDIPRSFFDVTDGDRKTRQRAKALQSFCDGVCYEAQLDETRTQIVRDSAIFGQGILKICKTEDGMTGKPKIAMERRTPWLMLADEQEAQNGNPSSIYELKWMDRQELMEMYPDQAAQIRVSSSSAFIETEAQAYVSANLIDWVVVVEGFHRPRVPGTGEEASEDGRHTIIVGDTVLLDEEYTWHRFPYEFCYMDAPIQGIYSEGIPNGISNLQFEINRIMLTISKSQRLAVGHWFVEQNSDINTNAIDDVVASIITYTGVKPEYVQFPPVTEDVYQYLWAIWAKGFEERGISQMAAMAQMPQGLKSSVAIDTYADVSSDRFKPQYRQYESWNMRVTEQILHLAAEIAEEFPDFEVKTTNGKRREAAIKWADAHLDESEYNLQIKEINALGETVSAKMQTVSDMTSAGLIDQDSGKRMLLEDGGMPDLQGYESLEASSYNYVEMCADKAIDEDIYIAPVPFLNSIPAAISQMRQLYLKAVGDDTPDSKLKMLRDWMTAAADLMPPAPPPIVPGPPGLPPGPGPVHKPGGPLAPAAMGAPPVPPSI